MTDYVDVTSGRLGALCLVTLFALILLRGWKPEWAPLLRLAAAAVFFASLLTETASILSEASALSGGVVPSDTWAVMLKSLGIALLTELCAGICRDGGEQSLAFFAETTGKLEILYLSLPLVRSVLDTALGLLS